MMKKKLIGSAVLALSLSLGCALPAYADSRKVVTLGADLTEDQKSTMLRYFGVSADNVDLLYITNDDEREHLGSYVPIEQIGNYTFSCALVSPTSSGGIQVKTANLSWVTCNMIASTLSTSGVTNCQVVAASPFEVSGTGALTGIIMAYESATDKTLDATKKDLANQELVATGNLATDVGQSQAIAVINATKIEVLENNVTDITEINNIINNVSNEYNVSVNEDQSDQIAELMMEIAQQEYDIVQLKATLERVQANVAADAGASEEIQAAAEEAAVKAETAAAEANAEANPEVNVEADPQVNVEANPEVNVDQNNTNNAAGGSVVVNIYNSNQNTEESILDNTDLSALEEAAGGAVVSEGDTTSTVQEQLEEQAAVEAADAEDFGIPEAKEDGTIAAEAPAETAVTEETTEAAAENFGIPEAKEDGTLETAPAAVEETEAVVVETEAAETEAAVVETEAAETEAAVAETEAAETEAAVVETEAAETEAAVVETERVLSEADLTDGEAKTVYSEISTGLDATIRTEMSNADGSYTTYLTNDAVDQLSKKLDGYVLKVLVDGADRVAAEEAADAEIPADVIAETRSYAEDRSYTDSELKQVDKYVRRVVFNDSEEILADCYLEDADKVLLYQQIMGVVEKAYGVEPQTEAEEIVEEEADDEAELDFPEDAAEEEADELFEAADEIYDTADNAEEYVDETEADNEFADFNEEEGSY